MKTKESLFKIKLTMHFLSSNYLVKKILLDIPNLK